MVCRLAQIVLEPAVQGFLFLLLPPLENFSPSAVVDVRGRDVADPFVIAPVAVKFDELR